MYITNTTNDVFNLFNAIENREDYEKLGFLIYLFNEINSGLINDKNVINVDLNEDDDINIFGMEAIGNERDFGIAISLYLMSIYKQFGDGRKLWLDNGSIIEIKYSKETKRIMSKFEKLSFEEKLDVISEIMIRWGNDTYFKRRFNLMIDDDRSGFDMAKSIQDYKNNLKK